MELLVTLSGVLLTVVLGMPFNVAANESTEPLASHSWSFEDDVVGQPPKGFSFAVTGAGRPGDWAIMADSAAPSGEKILAQTDTDATDGRFPVGVADAPIAEDLRLAVRCKPVSGKVDQACGLVFRYQDENNYYVTRANALEGNVRLYYVVNGRRRQVAGWDGRISAGEWHELVVEARGDQLVVFWDGARVIDASDDTFRQPGKVGMWTKADSVTYFDDLRLQVLDASP